MRKTDQTKHTKKRQEILNAARACFLKKGFKGTSVADICTAAGISPGHLYHYFDSKAAIVGGIIETALAYAASRFQRLAHSADPIESLIVEIERVKRVHAIGRYQMVLDVMSEASRNPAVGAIVRTHSRTLQIMLGDVLRHAQQRGKVDRNLDADLAAAVVISVIDGAGMMMVRGLQINRDKTSPLLKTLLTRFLSPQPDG